MLSLMMRDIREDLSLFSSGRARNGGAGKLRASAAARPRWNRRAMRARTRMPKESTDLIGSFRRENVFKLAGLLLDFRLTVHSQAVGKQALGQAMPPDNAAGPLPS